MYAKDAFCAIYDSAPVVNANNRKLGTVVGEGLGGGSRGYGELEPLFAKSETMLNKPESQFRGETGLFAECRDSG